MGNAAALFFGQAEHTLYARVTPTPAQREFLQEHWNALAEHLKQRLAAHGYPISTWIQGSYKYGTLIKPVHIGEEYDVDLGVYFEWEPSDDTAEPSPVQLREWVQRELVAYGAGMAEVKEVAQPPKERCGRLTYTRRFHIDVPAYHLYARRDRRRLATLSGRWEESDPKAIHKWFKSVLSGEDRDQLRRLIRYLKAWAAIAFRDAEAARPSSIMLTVLVSAIYSDMFFERLWGIDDDDALIRVIEAMYAQLAEDRDVLNPIDQKESLNRIGKDEWPIFMTRLAALRDSANHAKDAADEAAAALAWSEAFSYLMPLPSGDEVEIAEDEEGRALMQVPDVEVLVAGTEDFAAPITRQRNEVLSVAKGQHLRFRILNPQLVPAMALVEWTVRNAGLDSEFLGDLGHVKGGIGMFTVDERATYIGEHFMDLVIRCNGHVYAVRRIRVNVSAAAAGNSKLSPRAWIKLRSRKGRR